MKHFLKRGISFAKFKLAAGWIACGRYCFRVGLSFKRSRIVLNRAYNNLSAEERSAYHSKYWDLFRGYDGANWNGRWGLEIAQRTIFLPLRAERMWLDWDHCISLLGHDMEIKMFYLSLFYSAERPEVFLDVGANYGTHSLLFSCLGVPCVTFEPNSSCHPVFKEMCALNGIEPRIEHVAIAANDGILELKYPEKFTWLGSVKSDVSRELSKQHKLVSERVVARPLDSYLELLSGKKTLIKVDTEGNELEVFKGAQRIMSEARPVIVFETNLDAPDRGDIAAVLHRRGYEIYGLQLNFTPKRLYASEFLDSMETNFVAWPKEMPMIALRESTNCFR